MRHKIRITLAFVFLAIAGAAWGQKPQPKAGAAAKPAPAASSSSASHPGAIVAVDYLKAIHLHEWDKAVKLVEAGSLANLQTFQYEYLRAAPTMKEEETLLRLLGLKSIEDVKTLKPEEVFLRRGRAKTSKLTDKEDYLKQMRSTLTVKAIGTVVENETTVHVVVRKIFTYKERHVSELAFVSAVKEGGAWKVSLDAQEPEITRTDAKKDRP